MDECQPLLESKPSSDMKERVWVETKKLWTTAFPTMIARVGFFEVLVVTQAFIGQISELDLAAYALDQTITVRFSNGILVMPFMTFSVLYIYAFA